jgi:hypothetical protein
MRFLTGRTALSMVEYILGGALVLAVVGLALWQLAESIAARYNAFNNSL